jgi:hypothetical protein
VKKRRSARCPQAASGGALVLVQLRPPQTTAPASWRLTLPWVYHLGRAGGWQGPPEELGLLGQLQLRVLGARGRQPFRFRLPRSAPRTKEPSLDWGLGGRRGGRGAAGPIFFCKSPLGGITWWLVGAGCWSVWQGPPEGPIARARRPFRSVCLFLFA